MGLRDLCTVETLSTGIRVLKEVIGLTKDVKDLLPDGEKKDLISQRLVDLEKKSGEAEAQIAKSLGYKLCRCTYPPQIMLSIGYNKGGLEQFKCMKCDKIWPPDIDTSFLQMKVTDY